MSHHQPTGSFVQYVRGYLIVGLALIIGTALTVWAASIDLHATWLNVTVALIIAITKSSLVALFFMHLISEKQVIYSVLVCTVFFFAGLMGLTLWAMHDFPMFTSFK